MKGNEFDLKSHIDRAVEKFKEEVYGGIDGEPTLIEVKHEDYDEAYCIFVLFEHDLKLITVKPIGNDMIILSIEERNTKQRKSMTLNVTYGDIGYKIYELMQVPFDSIREHHIVCETFLMYPIIDKTT